MFNRRVFLASFSALFASFALSRSLTAQEVATSWRVPDGPIARALGGLQDKAGILGLEGRQQKAARALQLNEEFGVLLPEIIDLIDALEEAQPKATPDQSQAIGKLLNDAVELLGALSNRERMAYTGDVARRARIARRLTFEELRDGYLKLFEACTIRPERASVVGWYISILNKPKNRNRYEEVGQRLNIPWYFIGITHALEGSYNFRAHLHNGDPLRAKTTHVPKGRPVPWIPPSDWVSSASDAMKLKKFHQETDWSLAHMLYRFERYNGFGYRRSNVKINTPYLWSFSNHYAKGKYVRDGVFDPNAVSKQCGAAVLVKELAAKSIITLP